jgi:hypothetical protein
MHDVWSLFFHLVGVTGFMLAHGSSAGLAFAMRRERDPERMRRLLQLSEASFSVLYPSLLVLIAGGIVGAFRRHYWSFGWIWVAIGVLVVAFGIMFVLGGGRYSQVRKVLGIRYREGFKILPPGPAGTQQELEAAVARLQPFVLLGTGVVVIAVALYLMIAKPF